jgi:F-type H+-transporting ATPase subunit b
MLAVITKVAIVLAEEGGEVAEEATNPILPDPVEMAWALGTFAVLYLFMRFVGYPRTVKNMEKRSDKIRGDEAAADEAGAEAQTVMSDYQESLADARHQASQILDEARSEAEQHRAELMAQAQTQMAAIRQEATDEVVAAKEQAIADLRGEVGRLAVGAAGSVVQTDLDPAAELATIEEYVNQASAERR